MSKDSDDGSVTLHELAKRVFANTILCPICKDLHHKDFGVWNSDRDAIICVNCVPTLTAKKKVPKSAPKNNVKKCAACGGEGHWRSNSLACPKNKKNLASASSKGDAQAKTTTATTSTRKATKDTVMSKTKFIKVGTSPFDYTPVVDIYANDFNPTTTIFCVTSDDHKQLAQAVTPELLVKKYWTREIIQRFCDASNDYIQKRRENEPDLRV